MAGVKGTRDKLRPISKNVEWKLLYQPTPPSGNGRRPVVPPRLTPRVERNVALGCKIVGKS